MEKLKKKIIISIITIIVIISSMIGILFYLNNKKENNIPMDNSIDKQQEIEEETIKGISNEEFYNISNLVKQYYSIIDKSQYILNDGTNYSNDDFVKEGIYNILSKEYIKKNNVTIENVYKYVFDVKELVNFVPIEMKVERGKIVDKYLIYGNLINMQNKKYKKEYYFVNIDKERKTFSIEPIIQKYNDIEEIKFNSTLNDIQENKINHYSYKEYTDEDIVKQKFIDFKNMLLTKSEDVFNLLNEEYRNKKFGSYDEFKKYVDDNYERLGKIVLDRYQIIEGNNRQYICMDKEGKYYIFIDKEDGRTEVILDTYTINIPEFVKKYNSVNEAKKVGYNIEKFFAAINDKDYKYAYSKLDENFKKNKIPSIEKFENGMEKTLFKNNKVKHENVEKKGNTYVYDITVNDANNPETIGKKMTIIMMLKEDNDFVMSFSFK